MAITILEKHTDIAGKVRVTLTNGTIQVSFKFDHDPSNAELSAAAQAYQAQRATAKAAQDADDDERMTLREAVHAYEAGKLTNAQMKTLLEALVNRLKRVGLN